MGIKDIIKNAIDERNIIAFEYKGHQRIVEPYHYGKMIRTPKYQTITSPKDNHLLCYQIDGTSESKKLDYKSININLIKNLMVHSDKHFTIRSNYDPNDRKWEIEYGVNDKKNFRP